MGWGKRGVGICGVGCRGGVDLCKKANNYRIATKYIYIYIYSYLHLYIYIRVVGGLGGFESVYYALLFW